MFEFLKLASQSSWGVFFYFGCICVFAAATGFFAFKPDVGLFGGHLPLG